jgi:putative IMPACT (imprinted ancient) family translation regulator
VLLGTGGLVRAYQGAVSEALLHAEIRQQLLMQELMLTAEYTDVGKIQYLLSQAGFRTADTEYGAKVLFHVLVPAEEDAAIKLLTEKTNGKTGITKGELRNETCE